MTKHALVTGGLGFIGSNLVDALCESGWQVDVVDDMSNGHLKFLESKENEPVKRVRTVHVNMLPIWESSHEESRRENEVLVITGDFANDEVLSRVRRGLYSTVFHMAANPRVEYSVINPTETTEQNVLKTVGLFEVAASSGTRVVFSSSSAVYGNVERLPTKETSTCSPRSPYALQKYVCEQFATLFSSLYKLDVVCLRYFNVYGPRQYGDSPYATAIAAWCDKVANDDPLRSDGDGTQSRDMVYVGDVVTANITAALRHDKFNGDVYNVATGERYTNKRILSMFEEQFNEICITQAPERPGDVKHTQADVRRSTNELGFKAATTLVDGLKKTWEWWGLYNGK